MVNINTVPRSYFTRREPSLCRTNSLRTAGDLRKATISTTASHRSVFGWVQDKMASRAENKKAAKITDQIDLMANSPTWTLKMFADEINETLSSWTTKIPGASGSAEIQRAKATQTVVNAMVESLGENITVEDISRFDRKRKLKLVIACEKPMDEVDSVLSTFRQMDIMHRILRHRKEKGITMPTNEAELKMAMQQDGIKVMTKEEKQELRDQYSKSAMVGKS